MFNMNNQLPNTILFHSQTRRLCSVYKKHNGMENWQMSNAITSSCKTAHGSSVNHKTLSIKTYRYQQ